MPGPSKINQSENIPRQLPTLTRLIFHADPVTGIAKAAELQEALALLNGTVPSVSYPNQAAMLANTTLPIGYIAYVGDTGTSYIYLGPDHSDLNSYAKLSSEQHYRGFYPNAAALNVSVPVGMPGDYADVDVPGSNALRYIWDTDDSLWVASSGTSTAENGLHVDVVTGKINLGGPLVDTLTSIDKNSLDFEIIGVGTFKILTDEAGGAYAMIYQNASGNNLVVENAAEFLRTAIVHSKNAVTLQSQNTNPAGPTETDIQLTPLEILLKGLGAGFAGAKYFADYSGNFVARSLVDKAYVDNAASSAGHFKGLYPNEAALIAAYPTADPGDYADVDVVGEPAARYIWDTTDSVWVISSGGSEPVEVENGLTIDPGTGKIKLGGTLTEATTIDADDKDFIVKSAAEGLKYFDDYSANFGQRSLIDKAYVDNQLGGIAGTARGIWEYNSNTAPPPITGRFRMNNGTMSAVTNLYISQTSSESVDAGYFFSTLVVGDSFFIQQQNDATRWLRAKVSATPTDDGSYWTIPVTVFQNSGVIMLTGQKCIIRVMQGVPIAPGSPDTAIQFNDGGLFAGDSELKWDKTDKLFLIGNARLYVKNALESIFLGRLAGNLTTTGGVNLGIGLQALSKVTTGGSNNAIGANALQENTTGQENIAIGYEALLNNITGSTCIGIGYRSMREANAGSGNIGIGREAGHKLTGIYNLAIGGAALFNALNTIRNVALGDTALWSEVSGSENTAVGGEALKTQNGASENTAVGKGAGNLVSTGGGNTLLGLNAGANITTGSYNVVIGRWAYVAVATDNNQLSIQNAIYGVANDGTGTTISPGRIGLYVKAPTARLHIPAGQSTPNGAPLKMEQGPLLSTTETGAIEFDSTTGDLFFTTPNARISLTGRPQTLSAAVSAGTLNLNFAGLVEAIFNVSTTISANCTLTVTETIAKVFVLQFAVTGTVVITMPSTFVFETGEVTLGRWNSSTKLLTLTGATNTEYEIQGLKRGSVWRCISSKYV